MLREDTHSCYRNGSIIPHSKSLPTYLVQILLNELQEISFWPLYHINLFVAQRVLNMQTVIPAIEIFLFYMNIGFIRVPEPSAKKAKH